MSTLAKKLNHKKQLCEGELLKAETSSTFIEHKALDARKSKQNKLTEIFPVKKKRDRFNGLSEDDVMAKLLPDHLDYDLDIIIIGINPGLTAAHVGHHYAGPGNHFWKCLFLSGFTPEQMHAFDDYKLKNFGIGFTNIVARTTRGSADLTRTEIKEGAKTLSVKVQKYRPKIAVFNGKGIYEVFCGHKNFFFGKQSEPFPGTNTLVFVMPSSSARCAQLPRAVDKVPFYIALRKLRDHLSGTLPYLDESEVTFPDLELKVEPKREPDHDEATLGRETPRKRRDAKDLNHVELSPTKKMDSLNWSGREMMDPSYSDSREPNVYPSYATSCDLAAAGRYRQNFFANSSIPSPFGMTFTGKFCGYSNSEQLQHQCSSSLLLDRAMVLPRIEDPTALIKSETLQDMSVYGTMSFTSSNIDFSACSSNGKSSHSNFKGEFST